eukprot:GHVQ01013488.1.p1 GENE.GHVQ01013488.1~~GHVQ01013488.1.p1  ORF type:complete len:166 (-),score=25.28 GHVQ01013488.1:88-585(-)
MAYNNTYYTNNHNNNTNYNKTNNSNAIYTPPSPSSIYPRHPSSSSSVPGLCLNPLSRSLYNPANPDNELTNNRVTKLSACVHNVAGNVQAVPSGTLAIAYGTNQWTQLTVQLTASHIQVNGLHWVGVLCVLARCMLYCTHVHSVLAMYKLYCTHTPTIYVYLSVS